MRHAFIAAHQDQWPISILCEVLEVSRSGFYEYQARQATPKIDAEEVALLARVKAIAVATRSSYGSRRMAKALQAEGFAVGRVKARRLMKEAGVQVQRTQRRTPVTTDSRHGYEVAPNLLARHFDVEAPDVAWVGDITYVWTAEGWLYVSTLLDLYSRKVVGWAMSSRINTQLVKDALEMALGRRRPLAGLIHHRDRGSQYASHAYRDLLKAHGIECSMSGKGDCLDNAVTERFFGSLKREWTSHRDYDTRQEARDDIIEYIEMFYNSTRKHSYLGYLSPNDYEKRGIHVRRDTLKHKEFKLLNPELPEYRISAHFQSQWSSPNCPALNGYPKKVHWRLSECPFSLDHYTVPFDHPSVKFQGTDRPSATGVAIEAALDANRTHRAVVRRLAPQHLIIALLSFPFIRTR